MSVFYRDMWHCLILDAPIETYAAGRAARAAMTALPMPGPHRFLADPFGLWEQEKLYVFAENYDYLTRKGVIDVFIYDRTFNLLEKRLVLSQPWHLSYPYVFRHEGEIYLLPEAFKSGKLTLYRAEQFPFVWKEVPQFVFPIAAIDATPLFHAGKWWLFWTPPLPAPARQSVLQISVAPTLCGPWNNLGELYRDRAGARPGGTPWQKGENIILPVQDCTLTYGGGLRFLEIGHFDAPKPQVLSSSSLLPPPADMKRAYPDGLHTLAGAREVTLIDLKKRQFNLTHHLRRLGKRVF
ncbi:hypothetical protein E3E11_00105 [Oecophyllibacter saccharovorans]|nr:hypothetical protein E3E11_00105 [Oecophyllibacter saccharovorans]